MNTPHPSPLALTTGPAQAQRTNRSAGGPLPSGWWIIPLVISGAASWAAVFVWLF